MSDTSISDMSFEEAMTALEAVVNELDSGDVPLDKSIALYERGSALKAHCEARLKAAEEKVAQITANDAGEATGTTPVTDL